MNIASATQVFLGSLSATEMWLGAVKIWSKVIWSQLGATINGDAAGDQLGYSVSLNSAGDVIAVGAIGSDTNGSASGQLKVFSWDGTSWVQRGATINGDAAGDQLGYSVSLNSVGDVVAVGATGSDTNGADSGQLKVFAWNGTAWVQRGVTINGDAANNQLGSSSLSDLGFLDPKMTFLPAT